MNNKFLNIALATTAVAAIIVLVVFFIKLDGLTGSGSGTGKTEDETQNEASSSGSGNLGTIVGKQGTDILQPEDKSSVTPDPTADPSPEVTPSPEAGQDQDETTPSPTDDPETTPTPQDGEGDQHELYMDISHIDPEKPIVALTFDDGPSVNTAKIVNTLVKYNVHATFFIVGNEIPNNPQNVNLVYDSGSEVASHTVNHKNLNKLTKEEILKEINDNQDLLNKALGTNRDFLLRAPYGNANDTVKALAGHPLINWSVDTLDWDSKNAQSVFEEVKKYTKDGAIILMHDRYPSTAEAVTLVVPWLLEQGYQVCSVSEMFAARGVPLQNGVEYYTCISAEKYKESKQAAAGST